MSHVDEKNYLIVQYDMLIHEYTKSVRSKDSFVDIITQNFSNFKIPTRWPSFSSNFLNISDIDNFRDLIRLLRQNFVRIRIMTLSAEQETKKKLTDIYIENKKSFLEFLHDIGCEVYFTPLNHGKMTVTSQAVLFGSANYTITGLRGDLQWNVGHYFPKTKDVDYEQKRNYVSEKFNDSNVARWFPN